MILGAALVMAIIVAGVSAAHAELALAPPPDIDISAEGFFTVVDLGEPTVTGAAGDVVLLNDGLARYAVGKTVVTWHAMDTSGERAVAKQTVIVRDTTPPVFEAFPEHLAFPAKDGISTIVEFDLPKATDLVDLDVKVTSKPKLGTRMTVGDHDIVFKAVDDAKNKATMTRVITVFDAHPRVNITRMDPAFDKIAVSWEEFGVGAEYKLVVMQAGTGARLLELKTSLTSHTITGLSHNTEYKVSLHVVGDQMTKVTRSVTTDDPAAPGPGPKKTGFQTVIDGFESLDDWFLYGVGINSQPIKYNNYTVVLDDTGNPEPSAKISGDGELVDVRLGRIVSLDGLSDDDPLYVYMDIKVNSSRENHSFRTGIAVAEPSSLNRWAVYRDFLNAYRPGTWFTFGTDVSEGLAKSKERLGDFDSVVVSCALLDRHSENVKQTLHCDNLYVGTVPPPWPVYRGGSDGSEPGIAEPRVISHGTLDPALEPATPPSFRMLGERQMEHKVNTDYEDPGLECTGARGTWMAEPDLSGLDTNKEALYFVTYTCVGEHASVVVTRMVDVVG